MVVHNPVDAFLVVLITLHVPIFISTYNVPPKGLKAVVHNPVFSFFLALVHITVVHITFPPLVHCVALEKIADIGNIIYFLI
jgi:hypothetical protein